jgi:tRNA-specific 2-thiouridylase
MSGARVMVAMSGGVDSSVAALLLRDRGDRVVGATMCLGLPRGESRRPVCCGEEGVADARRVCDRLDIPHHVFDCSGELERLVVEPFLAEYRRGRTPNPCVVCNRRLKFGTLLERALALGFDALATGHYAGIEMRSGKPVLLRGGDRGKDQGYFLNAIPREALPRIVFPLAGLTKEEVRRIARRADLPVAGKAESQDICFLPGGRRRELLEERGEALLPGPVIDSSGRHLGRHRGIPLYTVGQRGGLGIASEEALYVIRIDAPANTIVVGPHREGLIASLVAGSVNRLADSLEGALTARVRHRGREVACRVTDRGETLAVHFLEPIFGVAPGQSVVLYRDDLILGGGVIEETAPEEFT